MSFHAPKVILAVSALPALNPSTTFVHSIATHVYDLTGHKLARVSIHCLLELYLQFPWPPLHRFSDIHVPAIGSCDFGETW